jgi:hypothetical protein
MTPHDLVQHTVRRTPPRGVRIGSAISCASRQSVLDDARR